MIFSIKIGYFTLSCNDIHFLLIYTTFSDKKYNIIVQTFATTEFALP